MPDVGPRLIDVHAQRQRRLLLCLVGIPIAFVLLVQCFDQRPEVQLGVCGGEGAKLVGHVPEQAFDPDERVGAVLAQERVQG